MMKNALLIIATASLSVGCVSDSDFATLSSQVNQLSAKLGTAENQLQLLEKELTVVKGQRVVRLPTGAPTATRQRSSEAPSYAMSEPERLFNDALTSYKGGNIQAAVQKFEQFAGQNPNDKNYANALYYLGEASYTMRAYDKARQALELLVYQTPADKINLNAVTLLEKVYLATGDKMKLEELLQFKQSL